MVGSIIHEYIVGSVIQHYVNLKATLSTTQYGFDKGLKVFKEVGYNATMKELDKNLIGKNIGPCIRIQFHDLIKYHYYCSVAISNISYGPCIRI